MHRLFIVLTILSFHSVKAQSLMSPYQVNMDTASSGKNWQLVKYAGISAGIGSLYGGYNSFLAAPIGLQLNRRLNNNFTAFAGISAGPAFTNFNRSFAHAQNFQTFNGGGLNSFNQLGIYSRIDAGIMYTNDQRTFSISGSIGIERGYNPYYPRNNMNTRPATKAGF